MEPIVEVVEITSEVSHTFRRLSSFFSIRQEYFHAASESRKVLLTNRNQGVSVLISVLTLDSLSPALDPSDLILTRGTLDEEDEEAESDTDDIDHRGERWWAET